MAVAGESLGHEAHPRQNVLYRHGPHLTAIPARAACWSRPWAMRATTRALRVAWLLVTGCFRRRCPPAVRRHADLRDDLPAGEREHDLARGVAAPLDRRAHPVLHQRATRAAIGDDFDLFVAERSP
jgi:hypothetical protein